MKKYLLSIFIATVLFNCKKTEPITAIAAPDNLISFGRIDSLQSKNLNELRGIWIHIPKGFNTSRESRYPVLYLLDGDSHFYSVSGMVRQLSVINGNTILPEMIIVGIPNTDRARDLTPTYVKSDPTSGGAEKFLDFIENELIPYIDKKYPTINHRTLIGHSIGGLAVVNTLIKRPQLFNNYLAIDPSLWWDNQTLLKKADSVLNQNKFKGKSLYVAVAKNLLTDMTGIGINEVERDTTNISLGTRSVLEFVKSAEIIKDNQLRFNWKYYQNEEHGSIPLIAEYDGLQYLFSWYKLKGIEKFLDSNTKAEDLINLMTIHYENISNNYGYKILPPEQLINMMGFGFMSHQQNDKAFALLNMNAKNYPKSPNVYDAMGDYYFSQTDTIMAIEYFNKSLAISDNNQITKEKVAKLKRK